MPKYVNITADDTISDTQKVTTGYFTGGVGTLSANNLTTSSLSTTQKNYYYTLQYSNEDQLSVTYGHIRGSGSDSVTNLKGETEAIYRHYSNLILPPNEQKNGIQFTSGTLANDIYVISAERARMKDRINKKNWTLILTGSNTSGTEKTITLTDDSEYATATSTTIGPRYNIKSGSAGTLIDTDTRYGWFFPNMGLLVFDGSQLSSSLPGITGASTASSAQLDIRTGFGLAPELSTDATADNAFKLVKTLKHANQTFRSEEDQTTVSYFCRAKARDFNFSNNPTFTSGSENRMTNRGMEGNPQTFISSVGLYNVRNELVAIGKLSSPVKKNYATEATIKVNLTY